LQIRNSLNKNKMRVILVSCHSQSPLSEKIQRISNNSDRRSHYTFINTDSENIIPHLSNNNNIIWIFELTGDHQIPILSHHLKHYPHLSIICVLPEWNKKTVQHAALIGVHAILFHKCSIRELHKAIDAVVHFEKYYCDDITEQLLHLFLQHQQSHVNHSNLFQTLTKREQEITRYLIKEYSNQEVAALLYLSVHTVATHRKNIFKKLKVSSISSLIRKYPTLP
jgi:DNA-binding NarL/FixJ family response regulator